MKYYITKDNDDGSSEVVAEIEGSLEDAQRAFSEAIQIQDTAYRVLKTIDHWHVLKWFDENDNQLNQES